MTLRHRDFVGRRLCNITSNITVLKAAALTEKVQLRFEAKARKLRRPLELFGQIEKKAMPVNASKEGKLKNDQIIIVISS